MIEKLIKILPLSSVMYLIRVTNLIINTLFPLSNKNSINIPLVILRW
jgi:hypothetical protein